MRSIQAKFFLWLANRVPNLYFLKVLKALLLRLAGVKVDLNGLYFIAPLNIDIPWRVSIGEGVFINRNCTFEGKGYVRIGNNVHIGPNVVFATTDHVLGKMDEVTGNIEIFDNVWIGSNVSVLQGVRVGPNVIVGAGAVVTKDFDSCIIAGVPAKVIKKL